MNTPNKFLLIVISFMLAIGLFSFVQYNTNHIISKSIKAIDKATCECAEE
jgi:YbbR domain-containing protein